MKNVIALLTMSAIALGSTGAFAASSDAKYTAKDNGGYAVKADANATTADGTDKSGQRKVDVSVDNDGSTSKTVTTTAGKDPKGLMNAKQNKVKTTVKHKANGGVETKKVMSHTDAAGTDTSTEVKTNVDANGNAVTETTKTVDPKGLMNETKTKTKTVNGEAVKAE